MRHNLEEGGFSSPNASHHKPKTTRRHKRKEYSFQSPHNIGESANKNGIPSCAQK